MNNQIDKDEQEQKALIRKESMDQFLASAVPKKKGAGGIIGDTLLSGLASAVAVPELAVGLSDITSGGRTGKFADEVLGFRPKEAKEAIAGWKSEEAQSQLRNFQETEGFGAKLGYALKNPSLISGTVVESLAPMLAGGVVGRGIAAAAPKISPVLAGAIGEGTVGAGMQAESIRQQTEDGLLTGKQTGIAAATGLTTAGFGFAGGKLAKQLGIGDFDTMIASGTRNASGRSAAEIAEGVAAASAKQPGILKRTLGGAVTEGLLEELPQSVSETILQNEALGRPLDEGVTDAAALGLLSGAAMGGFAGGFSRNRATDGDITPTEDMGQEAPRLGLPNPNRPDGNQIGYQGAISDPNNPNWIEDGNPDYFNRGQGPDAANMRNLTPDPELPYNSELGGQFSAASDGTVFSEAEYNDYLAQQQAQARASRDAGLSDVNDITPVPEGYDRSGNDPRLPPPRSDFEVTSDGTALTSADSNTVIQNERAANAERMARRLRGEIQDNTPIPNEAMGFGDVETVDNRKLSERMGLDPNKGSLSAAAAIAVDSGASSVAADFEQSNTPTQSAWQSGMMDRLSNADQNNSTYARLAQAMQNEPTSVSEKSRLMREAESLPRAEVAAKQIKPKTRVLDEAKAQTKAYTPEGQEVQAQWDVVDASDLVTSNTDNFTINPDFPSSRQPRDRTRASSQQQVNDIASKLQPNLLGESPDVSTGAPFVGANDNVVDSGNGRTMAIRRVYQEGSEKAQAYRQFVNEQAGKFGLDTDAVNMMQSPVLVRRNKSDMNRDEFARAANKPTAARMSSTEQATSDAKNLPDASLLSFDGEGSMSLYQSQKYIKNFIAGLPKTEQGSLMDDKGALSREGKSRIEAAIVQDAYNNPRLVSAISEKLDNDTTNVLRAVTDKAPQISQINASIRTGDVYENTLARDIADATQAYMDVRNSGKDINDYLSQDSLLGDGLTDGAKEILGVLSDNRRSAKAIGKYIQERINQVTGRGNPKQGGLSFDDDMETDAPNVLNNEPATQLTDENPTVNIPAPKKAPRELSDRAMVREMQKPTANNGEVDYKSKLNLSEGQNLGRLIMSSGRVFDDAVVKSMDDKGVTVEATVNGKRGLHKGLQYQTVDAGINNTKSYAKQQAAKDKPPQSPVAKPETAPALRQLDATGRAKDGKGIKPGEQFQTATNRETTPYPKQKSERYASQWLIDNAVAEAEARGNKFAARNFANTDIQKGGYLNTADAEGMQQYLFDESSTAADVKVTSLKDMAEANEQKTIAPKTKVTAETEKMETKAEPKPVTNEREDNIKFFKEDPKKGRAYIEEQGMSKKALELAGKKYETNLASISPNAQAKAYADLIEDGMTPMPNKPSDDAKTEKKKEKWIAPKIQEFKEWRASGKNHPQTLKYGRGAEHTLIGENGYGDPVYQDSQTASTRYSVNSSGKVEEGNNINPTAEDAGLFKGKPSLFKTIPEINALDKKRIEAENENARAIAKQADKYNRENGLDDETVSISAKPEPTPKPKQSVETQETQPEAKLATPTAVVAEIEDFGEKITGARKDMDSFYQREITNDDISNEPLSKIWPKKDIDAIEDKQTAALATVLRGTIPSKPRKGYKLDKWVAQVKNARGIMQQILSDNALVDDFIDKMTKVKGLQTTGYHAQLLSAIEQEQWARVTAVDHRPFYVIKNDDGSTSPDMSFDITIDKRRHIIPTENKQISEVVDRVNELLSGEVKSPTLKFDLYSRGRGDTKSWFITQASDKDKTALIEFNDRDTARAFLKENNADLTELWDQHKDKVNVKKSDMRSNVNRERIGPDHRSGQDVTTEQFMNTFGLRGGQFGNWVKQGANSKDRQNMLNDAYDAFMDLAGVLNIPPEAIGLGGKLAMSFGARGKGRAMAHYEPSQVIINLTKTKGAGSLAHEWFHALDHHFTSFRDSSDRNKTREATYITYQPEPSMMYTPQKGRGYLISKPALESRQANSNDPMYNAENWTPDPSHPQGVRPQVEEVFADLVKTLDESPMKERATTIDKGAPDGYWSRIIERAARAFESYVINKLEKQGARSDFLANVTPEDAFPRNMDRYPYLLESEMAPVAEAFDNLFATLDSKASEDGNGKTLFSRAGQMKQTMDNVKAGAIGSTQTTRQQVIGKLNDKFGKETIAKLMADGKLDIKVLSDYVVDGKLTIPSDVDGLYHNGKATLIADNLSDDMIIPTFLHELGGHGGMQTLMDKKAYDALMKDFDALVKAGDPLAMQAKAMADKVARNEQDALDEYLPYLITLASRQQAKTGKVAGMINRIAMAIRSWLRNTLGMSVKMNAQDVLALAERMVNEIEKQGSLDNAANAAPQFSDPNIPDKQMQDVRDQYENTDEWMKAPNGKPTNLTENQWVQTRTPAFKEWFGDWEGDAENASKVVDENGEPMVVYHGTGNDFNTFEKSKAVDKEGRQMMMGWGRDKFYFADNEIGAKVAASAAIYYGKGKKERVIPAFLNIKNPVSAEEYSEQIGRPDTPRKRDNIIKKLDQSLISQGYDGIVDKESGGIATFNPNQIKSATANAGTFDSNNNDTRYSKKSSTKIDFATHKPSPTDLRLQRAKVVLGKSKQYFDIVFKNDQFGSWIDVSENIWVEDTYGQTNVGEISHGIAFIDGELYELDHSAYFYLDQDPFWSPVVNAATPLLAKLYKDITGKSYPIFTADGSDPVIFDRLIKLKEKKGFKYEYDSFIEINSQTTEIPNGMKFSRAGGMTDQFDPINMARESKQRLYDWASSAPPGKLSWWHKTIGTMYNLAQRNPYFKPVFDNTEKFINDVSYYASKASEFAPRLLPQLDSIRDITKSAIGAKDNEALSKPIFEGTLLWGRDLDGKAVLIEDWRKKVMATSKQDRLKMLQNAGRITPAQEAELATLNNIQANRFINGIIDEEVNAGLVWTDNELRSKFNLDDKQIELYREFRAATDKSLDSLTRSDMLRKMGKDANDIESQVMEVATLREAVFVIEQHINSLIQASPKKEKSLKATLKEIKESKFRTDKLKDDGYAPLSRFGQYTVDVVDSDGNREYFGMFESAYEARKMKAEMDALYGNDQDYTVTQGALSNEEFKLFAGVTPETAELFGEMLGLDATGDKAADEAFQEYLKRTKNNRSAMKRLMHRKGIKGYSEDVGRVLASFIYSNARHTSAALNMGNLDRSIADIPKGEGQLKDAAVKLAQYIKNPQEEGQLIRGWMFAQYLGGSIASAAVNLTQPIAVSFPYLSQFGGAVKAASQLKKSSGDWIKAFTSKSRDHFEPDLLAAIERAEADGTLSPQEVHNLLKQASGKNPLRAGDGTKVGDAKALASNSLSRASLAWGVLFSGAEQINRRVTFVAAYRLAKDQGMDDPADFATKSIKETQFVYNKASRMNWGRGAVGGTLMTFKTYTVSYMELMHRLWTQGEKGSEERKQGQKAVGIMLGTLFLLGGAGGLPFMEDAEDLIDGIGQIMGYNLSSKKWRQDFLDEWTGEMMGDFLDGGISSLSGSPADVSGRLGLGNLIPGTGIFKERTSNSRDVLEIVGPAGDFVGRVATGTRDIAKGVANLDSTSLKKGALEFAPTAVRNAVKGTSMATSGIYKDTKGYKVADVSPIDAAFKFVGFQPRDISKIQEANYLGQSSTSYYNLRASSIRALWAAGVVEGNESKVADAKAAVKDWNEKNPNQKIIVKPNDIARRVREMRMDKSDRVVKRAPKSSRGILAQDLAKAGQ